MIFELEELVSTWKGGIQTYALVGLLFGAISHYGAELSLYLLS